MGGSASRENGRKGGRPKGSLGVKTLEKVEAREFVRKFVTDRLLPIMEAHALNATGAPYMLVRNEDGTFRRAQSEADIDEALKRGGSAFQILTQQPNTQSMQTLLAYALDKPKEQDQDINLNVTGGLLAKVEAARKRAKK